MGSLSEDSIKSHLAYKMKRKPGYISSMSAKIHSRRCGQTRNGLGGTMSNNVISAIGRILSETIKNENFIQINKILDMESLPVNKGQFATVYHCRHRVTGEEFAAKFSSRWRLGGDCTADILHEIAVSALLRHNLRTIHMQDVFSNDTELVLVMEFAAGGDLQTLLDDDMVPYEHDVLSFTRQLLEGLVMIHDLDIVHLDIKPQNLVLMGDFPDCAVKLCDFEISRMLTAGREVREILGTPDYVAPEILCYEPITKKTDMWSLGVLTYVLLTGFLPFGGDTDQETFVQISRCELDFPAELFDEISPQAIDFIKSLLLRQPERRMSVRECLSHPWMNMDKRQELSLSLDIKSLSTTNPKEENIPLALHSIKSESTSLSTVVSTVPTPKTESDVKPTPTADILKDQEEKLVKESNLESTPAPKLAPISIPRPSSLPISIPNSPATPVRIKDFKLPESIPTSPISAVSESAPLPGPFLDEEVAPSPPVLAPVIPIFPANIPLFPSTKPPTILSPTTPVMQIPGSQSITDIAAILMSPLAAMPPLPKPTLKKQDSRKNNMERLKSLSKSREVLSERIQLSNLKKTMSKSRERLCEARLGISRSRERFIGLRSFSQSVEALYAVSKGNPLGMYQSCSNVCNVNESNSPSRMYNSMAAIDQLDSLSCPQNLGYFDSRFSLDSDDYNERLTRHNTNMNSFIAETANRGHASANTEYKLRGSGRGGRNVEPHRCSKHNHQKPEAQPTQRIVPKISRAERMKRDAQRRRKEKKERERLEKEKQKNASSAESEIVLPAVTVSHAKSEKADGSSSPIGRRGSVFHVEQRLAERHERQQERLERQEKDEKPDRRGSVSSGRRRGSVDLDIRAITERLSKSNKSSTGGKLGLPQERPRSVTPTRRTRKKSSPQGSDISLASSSESVNGNLDSPRTPPIRPTTLELPEISLPAKEKSSPNGGDVNDNIVIVKSQNRNVDEAFVSLDDPQREGVMSRSRSIESALSTTTECKLTAKAKQDTKITTKDLTKSLDCLKINDSKSDNKLNPALDIINNKILNPETNKNLKNASEKVQYGSGELTIICEEGNLVNENKNNPSYVRSVSTSSDIGSMISESSECSTDIEQHFKSSSTNDLDIPSEWRSRARSMSIQPGSTSSMLRSRNRSNSVQLDTSPVTDKSRPWGQLCNGAVAKAMEKFNLGTTDVTPPVAHSVLKRRKSSPHISPMTDEPPSFPY
ncbi:unnamed protein product, partial [Meganyctiphanes norvegica]